MTVIKGRVRHLMRVVRRSVLITCFQRGCNAMITQGDMNPNQLLCLESSGKLFLRGG
ncbi:hypothetical protein HanXRQr2_Chr16g0740221 [Helianthus annuus]|uniref:Uncharacterized protein n=1 Tax=Helianthus annuus TaxID=4232 RepID=A0A9K3DS46_HELAN|nr:hypothetical protein HanXRQr2_Chr16g0740221 [Helianthus annuus]KAJ0820599.1 hypothetical protein HanPSC8_Chr16g0709881 [Helianthus annuus]